MEPEINVYFVITGEVSPNVITEALDIKPTKTWKKGDSIPDTIMIRKNSGWVLESKEVANSISLSDYIKPLLEILLPKAEEVTTLCNNQGLYPEISCAIYISDETPAIDLTSDIIEQVAKLRTAIDVDILLIGKE